MLLQNYSNIRIYKIFGNKLLIYFKNEKIKRIDQQTDFMMSGE